MDGMDGNESEDAWSLAPAGDVQTARVAEALPVEVSRAGGGPPPEDPFVRAGRRRVRWFLGGTLALGLALASVGLVADSSQYESRAALLVRAPGGEAGLAQAVDGALESEREILKSYEVLRRTLDRVGAGKLYPDLRGDSIGAIREAGVDRMREALSVRTPPGTDVIEVSFRHGDPELTAEVVNKLVTRFQRARSRVLAPAVSRHRLYERIVEQEAVLADAETELSAFLSDHPDLASGAAHAAILDERASLERELRTERWVTQHLERAPLDDPSVYRTRTRVEELQLQFETASVLYAEGSTKLENLAQEIGRVRRLLAERERAARKERDREVALHRERQAGIEAELARFEAAERALPELERERRELVRARDLAVRRLDVYRQEFDDATREVERGRRRLAAATHVLTHASPPESRTVPPDEARIAWLLLGGALLVVFLVIAADVADDHRHEPTAPVLYAARLGVRGDDEPISLAVPQALVGGQRSR